AISGYAFLTPFWKVTVDAMYSRIHSLSPVLKVIPALSLLFFPAVVAGMMLPVLAAFSTLEQRAKRAASLFGSNAAGAMVGVLFAVHAIIPSIGINRTILA